MFDEDSLALRLNVLKSPEEWAPKRQGLTFLFPNGGVGKYVSGPVAEPLSTGDVLVLNGRRAGRVCALRKGRIVFWSFSLRLEHLFPLLAPHEISLLKQFAESLKVARHYPASSSLARECHFNWQNHPAVPRPNRPVGATA
jgi:hypothetical protein